MTSRNLLIALFISFSASHANAACVADSAAVATFKNKVESMPIDSKQKAQAIAKAEKTNERIEKFFNVVGADVELSFSPRQHHITSWFNFFGLKVEPVKRFRVGVSYINYLGLCKQDGVKSYLTSHGIGGSLSYRLYQPDAKRNRGIEAMVRYGHSLGNGDLKYNLYDVGIKFYDKLGVGFRCVDSRTEGLRNTNCVYFSWSIL